MYIPTATTIGYGSAVSTEEEEIIFENQGCLGLQIRLPNESEANTTTAHPFVKLMAINNVSRILYQASDSLVRTARLFES